MDEVWETMKATCIQQLSNKAASNNVKTVFTISISNVTMYMIKTYLMIYDNKEYNGETWRLTWTSRKGFDTTKSGSPVPSQVIDSFLNNGHKIKFINPLHGRSVTLYDVHLKWKQTQLSKKLTITGKFAIKLFGTDVAQV